ncbi:MAG: hydroxymethylbilane synthase [Actinobacteria bacterium]|nr:hydroxymethylbilane synthase [Actinomycetota bacterium]
MAKTYKIGTRTSPLALRQVDEVVNKLRKFYPEFQYKIIGINTHGDRDRITPISKIEGTDFFTQEIDVALLGREIDFAVHSAKDLPDEIPKDLTIAAITRSVDPFDALVSKGNLKIDQLPSGAKIGASSLRRKTQLKKYRKDFQIISIRGNIEERLQGLDFGYQPSIVKHKLNLDAIIVAACALVRLGLKNRITQRITMNILRPHPLQGSLAIVVRKDDTLTRKFLNCLSDE